MANAVTSLIFGVLYFIISLFLISASTEDIAIQSIIATLLFFILNGAIIRWIKRREGRRKMNKKNQK